MNTVIASHIGKPFVSAIEEAQPSTGSLSGRKVIPQQSTSWWAGIASWLKNKGVACLDVVQHPVQNGIAQIVKYKVLNANDKKAPFFDDVKINKMKVSLGSNIAAVCEGLAEYTSSFVEKFWKEKVGEIEKRVAAGTVYDHNFNPIRDVDEVKRRDLIPVYVAETKDFIGEGMIQKVTGPKIVVMAEREWLKKQTENCFVVGFKNLKDNLNQKQQEDPGFIKRLLIDQIHLATDHMRGYDNHKKLPDYGHSALIGSPQIQENRKKHEKKCSEDLISLMYPKGMDDLPVSEKYRKIVYEKVLPSCIPSIFENIIESTLEPDMVNQRLMQVLDRLPEPKDLTVDLDKSPNESADPDLSRSLGVLIGRLFEVTDPDLLKFFEKIIPSFENNVGTTAALLVQSKLRPFMVPSKQGEVLDSGKCLDAVLQVFNKTWLQPTLQGKKTEKVDTQKLVQKLVRLRKNVPAYIKAVVENKVIAQAMGVNKGVGRLVGWIPFIGKHLLRWLNFGFGVLVYLGWEMIKAVVLELFNSICQFAFPVFYSHWKEKRNIQCKKIAEKLVGDDGVSGTLHHSYHEHLVRNSIDLIFQSFRRQKPCTHQQ